jgi:hypothetical protein
MILLLILAGITVIASFGAWYVSNKQKKNNASLDAGKAQDLSRAALAKLRALKVKNVIKDINQHIKSNTEIGNTDFVTDRIILTDEQVETIKQHFLSRQFFIKFERTSMNFGGRFSVSW